MNMLYLAFKGHASMTTVAFNDPPYSLLMSQMWSNSNIFKLCHTMSIYDFAQEPSAVLEPRQASTLGKAEVGVPHTARRKQAALQQLQLHEIYLNMQPQTISK